MSLSRDGVLERNYEHGDVVPRRQIAVCLLPEPLPPHAPRHLHQGLGHLGGGDLGGGAAAPGLLQQLPLHLAVGDHVPHPVRGQHQHVLAAELVLVGGEHADLGLRREELLHVDEAGAVDEVVVAEGARHAHGQHQPAGAGQRSDCEAGNMMAPT